MAVFFRLYILDRVYVFSQTYLFTCYVLLQLILYVPSIAFWFTLLYPHNILCAKNVFSRTYILGLRVCLKSWVSFCLSNVHKLGNAYNWYMLTNMCVVGSSLCFYYFCSLLLTQFSWYFSYVCSELSVYFFYVVLWCIRYVIFGIPFWA